MRQDLHSWRILVDLIIDKVWEYIDEFDLWEKEVTLWVDAESEAVNLGEGNEKRSGVGSPISPFIATEEDGTMSPNVDYIEEYAYQWFDFRQ